MEEIVYLLLTILIEAPVAVIILCKEKWKRAFFAAISVNFVSHPIAWLLSVNGLNWWVIEGLVIIFESIIFVVLFSKIRKRAMVAAITMNVVSATVGFFL